MTTPNTSQELWQEGGFDDSSLILLAAAASNLRFGTNPAYGITDFLSVYPQFGSVDGQGVFTGIGNLSQGALQIFVNLASASLSQDRWQDSWTFGMALFIAHYATLHLKATEGATGNARQIAQAGLAKGVQVSKSADLSTGYQAITAGWESWGQFNLTMYGQQLIGMAKLIGKGPMMIW